MGFLSAQKRNFGKADRLITSANQRDVERVLKATYFRKLNCEYKRCVFPDVCLRFLSFVSSYFPVIPKLVKIGIVLTKKCDK